MSVQNIVEFRQKAIHGVISIFEMNVRSVIPVDAQKICSEIVSIERFVAAGVNIMFFWQVILILFWKNNK